MFARWLKGIFAVMLAAGPVYAQTIIPGGNVSGTWTQAGSPFIIQGDVTIPMNDSLVIQPGVEVRFELGTGLTAEGRLSADGTVAPGQGDTIRFTSNRITPQPGDWDGLYLGEASTSELIFCSLEYGDQLSGGAEVADSRISMPLHSELVPLLTRCLVTLDLEFGDADIWFLDCVFTGSLNFSEYPANGYLQGCVIEGDLSHPVPGVLWAWDCRIAGNYISTSASNNSDAHFIGCDIGGDVINPSEIWLQQSTVHGEINATVIEDVNHITLNRAVIHGKITTNYRYISITESVLLDSVEFSGAYSLEITGNTMYGSLSGGFSSMGFGGPVIQNNILRGGGISLSVPFSDFGGRIEGNAVLHSPGDGIRVLDLGGTLNSLAYILNNTVYDAAGDGISGDIQRSSPDLVFFENNNVVNSGGYGLSMTGPGTPVVHANNTFNNALGHYQGVEPGYWSTTADPLFVDPEHDDFRLQWGSPLINHGVGFYEPDGTYPDMGAFFFNMATPVRVLLTPHNLPMPFPEEGGTFDYTIRATNPTPFPQTATIWCDLVQPDSIFTAPVFDPTEVTIPSGATMEWVRTQQVPASASGGLYVYRGFAQVGELRSEDRFFLVKEGLRDEGVLAITWPNWGDPLDDDEPEASVPESYALHGAYPNPFNPTTALSYQLTASSRVSLKIYDTAGREVTTLVDGWRDTGSHQVTFDASGLASGIYFARLEAGDFNQVQKLVLLK